jgi:hypothetical protein
MEQQSKKREGERQERADRKHAGTSRTDKKEIGSMNKKTGKKQ